MNNIDFHIEAIEVPELDPEFLRLWITYVVSSKGKQVGDLSYIFCSNEYLLDINIQHLGHHYYTDIITFNYNEEDRVSGDLFISHDMVKENAMTYANGNVRDELERVIIHGVLHLIGYNDKSDEEQEEMTKMEDWALGERARFT